MTGSSQRFEPRAGDEVVVLTARELLAVLDEDGATDGMPFMPEMLPYVGRRLHVYKRAERVCDFFSGGPTRLRSLTSTVLLGDLRCQGTAHGGCMARCRLFWKEDWIRSPDSASVPDDEAAESAAREELERRLQRSTRVVRDVDGAPEEVWRCQATDVARASTPIFTNSPRAFIRELTTGNVSVPRFLRISARAVAERIGRKLRLVSDLPVTVAGAERTDGEQLDLKPGEWVEVRTKAEIGNTLDAKGTHRGLSYTAEMVPACGRRYRVADRVERIIDERTGRMNELKRDCITLEGFVCKGDRVRGAWFCPREGMPYFREAWLKRAETPTGSPASNHPSS